MNKYRVLLIAVFVLLASALVYAATAGDDSWTRLMDGNKNFVGGALSAKNIGEAKRKELTSGQHPFATVLTCSDSRVSPELIFDRGLGEIFVVRTAGNVVDPIAIGSIEYGVEHLNTPLLVIMGHQFCGAVKAAYETKGAPEGNIGAILKKIMPAVKKAKAEKGDDTAKMNAAVQENVRNVDKELLAKSKILKELVHEGKLKIVLAEYYLDSGKVEELAVPVHVHH
jgi:carbonic anhydrase